VELPALDLSTLSDSRGRFQFSAALPAGDGLALIVKARGRLMEATVDRPTSEGDPFVVRFDNIISSED
jgi:hypothetical protein